MTVHEKQNNLKKTTRYSILALLILLLATSCEERDIWPREPVGEYNEQNVFRDLNLIQALIGRAYDYWGDESSPLNCKEDLLASATDETLCTHRPTRYTWTVGTMTPDEAREVIEISLSILEARSAIVELQRTRSKASLDGK